MGLRAAGHGRSAGDASSGRRERRTEDRRRASHSQLADSKAKAVKVRLAGERTRVEQLAEKLTRGAASPVFLLFHVVWFGAWIPWNLGAFGLRPFDPFPFGLLTMVVSLEAIFLSIFVLMAQGRESRVAELREEITLQVDSRMEEEVTKTLQLVAGLYGRLGLPLSEDDEEELGEMLKPLDQREIESEMTQQIEAAEQE